MTEDISRARRILIIRNAYSFDFGGGERIPVELAQALQDVGFNPIVASRSDQLLDFARSKNVPTVRSWWWSFQDWSSLYLLLFPVYLLWQLVLIVYYLFLIKKVRADVVHPQSRDDFIAATIAARLLHKPVLWTDHADLKYVYRNKAVWYKNPIAKMVYWLSKRVRRVIVVSGSELDEIKKSLGHAVPKNYQVIYNGVSDSEVTPAPRSKADHKATIFVATSRLVKSKGIQELIEAFITLAEDRDDLRLWLIGTGPDEKLLMGMTKDQKHIVFLGHSANPLPYVATADVFVHPSYHEGFSVSLVEAAKLGLPIIACDTGGNTEIVTDQKNGLLVPVKDIDSLAVAMDKLARSSNLRKDYGRASRKIYEKKFVWENIVEHQYRELYE